MAKNVIRHKNVRTFLKKHSYGKEYLCCFNEGEIDFNYDGIVYYEDDSLLGKDKISQTTVDTLNSIISKMSDNTTIAVLIKSLLLFDNRKTITAFRKSLISRACVSNILQLDNDELKVGGIISAKDKKYAWTSLLVLKKCSKSLHLNEYFCNEYTDWRKEFDDYEISYAERYRIYNDSKSKPDYREDIYSIIKNNSYRLLPSYLLAKVYVNEYFDKFSKFANVYNGCHSTYLSQAKEGGSDSEEHIVFQIVKINQIEDLCIYPLGVYYYGDKNRFEKYVLKEGDIILSSKNSKFDMAIVSKEIANDNWVPSNNFLIIRPKPGVCTAYLFNALNSWQFKQYIKDITSYEYYASLRIEDILDGPVLWEDERGTDMNDKKNKETADTLAKLAESYFNHVMIRDSALLRSTPDLEEHEIPYLRQLHFSVSKK